MSENWVDGTLESGADDDQAGVAPDQEVGAGLGLAEGEPNTFEPEEAAPPADDSDADQPDS